MTNKQHIHEIEEWGGNRTCKTCWLQESTIDALGEEKVQPTQQKELKDIDVPKSQQKDAGKEIGKVVAYAMYSGGIFKRGTQDYEDELDIRIRQAMKIISQVATQARQQAFQEIEKDVEQIISSHRNAEGKEPIRLDLYNYFESKRANIEKRRKG